MSDNLRLERIRVNKLFDRFNYDIDLNNGFDVGILIAPNGCGKTTIFNLVSFIFNPSFLRYRNIVNVPFDFCECTLSNKKVVTLWRKTSPLEESKHCEDDTTMLERSRIGLKTRTRENVELKLTVTGSTTPIDITKQIRNILSPYDDIDLASLDNDNFDGLDLDDMEMIDDLHPRFRMQLRYYSALNPIKEYLQKNECNLNTNYIRADRLHKQLISRDPMFYRRHGIETSDSNPLSQIQNKTKKLYKKITDEYNNLQRNMKDRLPKMYLDKKDKDAMDFPTFQKRWSTYLSNIEKYHKIGLPTSEPDILEMDKLEDAFNKKKAFLTVYLEAFESTLEPLERNYPRLKLFVDTLTRRNSITRKVFKYGEEGIVVMVGDEPLPLECLSSGEKNDFVMFYNLIFDSEKNGLVLVDEPEISLHIEWQEEYLDCLLDICKMNSLQAIIATHSPNIVNGHFELYAERGLTDADGH